MNPKIEALLKIIAIPEEEQYNWLWQHHDTFGFDLKWVNFDIPSAKKDIAMHLALLAFQLRDECHDPLGWCAWDRACWEVWKYYHEQMGSDIAKRERLSQDTRERYCLQWMSFWAKPIYWVLAALITKEIVADTEEKFDAHLYNMERVRTGRICGRCGGMDGHHKQVDDPKAGNSHMPCPRDIGRIDQLEMRVLEYAIGQDNGEGRYGMWYGPNPLLVEMLDGDGRDKNSVIIRFNPDGTDEIIYRWTASGWVKQIETI